MLSVETRVFADSAIGTLARNATPFLFFTGKGGVGKTSVGCAVAVALADAGKRVLIVSTDPASNLDEVLATGLSDVPRPVDGLANLYASNLDPEVAAASYRDGLIDPYRGILPDATVASMEEQLSGACTVEIAAFNEFAKLVGDESATQGYDVVIFDTAPTGHTLRLLTLPTAWTDFIETNTSGNSCLGPLAGLKAQRELYARTVEALADGSKTTLVLVSRADTSALAEAARSSMELADLGIRNQVLVLNGLFTATVPGDPMASALERRGAEALAHMPAALASLPRAEVPLVVRSPLGIEGLRSLADAVPGIGQPVVEPSTETASFPGASSMSALIDELAEAGSGVVMTMGKGGVGKTSIAAAIALELVRRGHLVHLSTTDPAAHVAATVAGFSGGLTLSRIDPEVEVEAYRAQVLAGATSLDPEALSLLEEDLRSPCTEEIAIFRAFARVVAEASDRFVILDTAPTGHTLLLIDSSEAYHREVMRNTTDTPPEVLALLPRLRDPEFTKVLIVTLAEATPISEARRLQTDLSRAGIASYAWVVNQSFAETATTDPVLRARGVNEVAHIESVIERERRVAIVPWVPVPPVGEGLFALVGIG
ncbi:MAG TPA: arsenical pump-driving ATPase [Coriobacteriia bacterium]